MSSNDNSSNECSICFSEIQNDFKIVLDCSHFFCRDCMKQIRDPTCPCCRAPITSKSVSQEDIDAMNSKKSEDKKEREQRLPGGIPLPNDIREFLERMDGNIRVEVVAVPVELYNSAYKLYSELKSVCGILVDEFRKNPIPLENAITVTVNAVMLRSLCLDKNTDGCVQLTFIVLKRELPKIYKNLEPSYVKEKIKAILSHYNV